MPETKRESRKLQFDDFCTDYGCPISATISNPWWRKHLKEGGLGSWILLNPEFNRKSCRLKENWMEQGYVAHKRDATIKVRTAHWHRRHILVSEQFKQIVIWKAPPAKVLKFTAGIAKDYKTQLKKHSSFLLDFPGLPVSSL